VNALEGETDVTAGVGLTTAKSIALEIPPPGAGFTTTSLAVPTAARSASTKVARSWESVTY
jgi:hypothetical protein